MQSQVDAVVIGGGPGGTSAAGFLAQSGARVVLVEKERFPRYHIGESLLPATTLGFLRLLGVSDELESRGFVKKRGGTFRWGANDEPWSFRFYATNDADRRAADEDGFLSAFQVERAEYDEMLLRHVEKMGVEIREGNALSRLEGLDAPLKTVVTTSREGEARIQAPFVLDASGSGSPVRKLFGQRHYDPFFKNVAVFRYFTGGKRLPPPAEGNVLTVSFDEGWFWFIPLRKDRVSVGLVVSAAALRDAPGQDMSALFDQMLERAPMVARLLSGARQCRDAPYDRVRTVSDYSYAHSQFSHHGVFLVGDSACFIDPLFSSGVHLATYAGYLAARAVASVRDGARLDDAAANYETRYRREYAAFYRFLVSFYELEDKPDSTFWSGRKLLSANELSGMDDFVRLASGRATTDQALFSTHEDLRGAVKVGKQSLSTLIGGATRGDDLGVAGRDARLGEARRFMAPIHESRHEIFGELAARDAPRSIETNGESLEPSETEVSPPTELVVRDRESEPGKSG